MQKQVEPDNPNELGERNKTPFQSKHIQPYLLKQSQNHCGFQLLSLGFKLNTKIRHKDKMTQEAFDSYPN